MIDVKEVFPWWFIIFFDKKTSVSNTSGNIKREIVQNKKIAEELHKPIITKFGKRKVNSSFKDNIWGADLVDK